MYSINILNNEGVLYHIRVHPSLVQGEAWHEIDYDSVQRVVRACGFEPGEVYYECVPDSEVTILDYVYDTTVIGNLRKYDTEYS